MTTKGDERFKCSECGRIAASAANLRVHMRTHTGEKPYECKECGNKYQTSRSLKNHIGLHSEDRPFRCPVCSKGFVTSRTLKDHQRIHTLNKPFQCTYCGKAFNYKNVLASHLIIHTGEGPHKCAVCGRCFIAPSRLKEHMRSHTNERPFACEVCGDRFTKHSALERHKVLHTGIKKYQCSICDKKFIVPSELKAHMENHSDERYPCHFCGRSFKNRNILQKHIRQGDIKGTQVCCVCTKEFKRYCQLTEHMKTHKGKQIYNCTKCVRSFTLLTDLRQHRKESHGLKIKKSRIGRHLAIVCPQKGIIKSSEKAKSYKCNICGLMFNNKVMLHTHKVTHQNESNTEREDAVLATENVSGNNFESDLEMEDHFLRTANIDDKQFECSKIHLREKSNNNTSENVKSPTERITSTNGVGIESKSHFENIMNEIENYNMLHMKKETKINMKKQFASAGLFNGGNDCISSNPKNAIESSTEKKLGHSDSKDISSDDTNLISGQVGQIINQCSENAKKSLGHTSIMGKSVSISSDMLPYQCAECGKYFKTSESVQCHMKTHKEDEILQKCTICGMCFGKRGKLRKHMMLTHANERPYVCDICGNGFTSNFALAKHKALHSGDKKHLCTVCDKKFQLATDLKLHMCSHSGQMYFCPLCSSSFTEKRMLRKHIQMSEIKGPRKCNVCFLVLKGKCQMKGHMKSHVSKKILKCNACKKIFMLRQHYKEHIKIHRNKSNQQYLETHHSNDINSQLIHSQNVAGSDDSYANKNNLIESENGLTKTKANEEKAFHSEDKCNNPVASDEDDMTTSNVMDISRWRLPLGTRFKCTECGKISARFSDLTMTMSLDILDIVEMAYVCWSCDKKALLWPDNNATQKEIQFSDDPVEILKNNSHERPTDEILENNSQERPVEIHQNNSQESPTIENDIKKSYRCSWCGFNSIHNSQLRQHLKSHWQAAESHKCNLCELTFHSELSLTFHKKTHGQGTPELAQVGEIPQQKSMLPVGTEVWSDPPPTLEPPLIDTPPPPPAGCSPYHGQGYN